MSLVLTAEQLRRTDTWAIETLGLPGMVLMENAGRGVVRMIQRKLKFSGESVRKTKVAVVCGAGQNGGDGFVIARHLSLAGAEVRVLMALPDAVSSGDALANREVLRRMGTVPIEACSSEDTETIWTHRLHGARVIVDAIFGTGLSRPVTGVPAIAIAAMNQHKSAMRVAVDIPSGCDADTGRVLGIAVQAHHTGTVAARKLGMSIHPDAPTGEVEVIGLGVPLYTPADRGPYARWLESDAIRALLPRPPLGAHKGSRGHVLLVAGSPGKTGAAALCARAAQRGGAGLVTIAVSASMQADMDARVQEAMTLAVDATDPSALVGRASDYAAIAVGPGMATDPSWKAVVLHLAREVTGPLVLDADALNHLGPAFGAELAHAAGPRIVTPHPGEAARLLATTTAAVAADRVGAVRRLAREGQCVAVLKGARTLIATSDGSLFINPAADPALATAGSGDVLTGLITALCAQGLSAVDAACVGVFAHAAAATDARATLGTGNLIAGDLPEAIARWIG
ncbi:MAG: NAD(P)H-hydrate dehydratase [Deltaproteobacteria bacterium]|nr:NAD(P)H-hydrate dehydratase [Deltaproteobacteria bacterium]